MTKRVIQKAPGKPKSFTKAQAVAAIKRVVADRERAAKQETKNGSGRQAS
ncbi:hypothetical protein LzC2_26240 [Planctomycetes bacterium LzC2]|uniref:Uncharacterized protein n=1 Tax=Alienimonas chondri TaxID=2681879 RepID=A0ABX1VF73_9PLAN|nr:hypothetical protein [Alienimonas chondri]